MNTRKLPEHLAEDLVGRSNHNEFRLAAVIFDRKGVIFSWGWNNGWEHAETHAIRRANRRRLPGATILVLGRKKTNQCVFTTKPCENCERKILVSGISRIIYSMANEEDRRLPNWVTLKSAFVGVAK